MVNTAEQTARNAEADLLNPVGFCLQQVRGWAGIPARFPDAATAAAHTEHRLPGDIDPPRGSVAWWSGGSEGHGHVALNLGGGRIRTTDGDGPGRVATRPLSWPTEEWGLTYLFSSWDLNGETIPHDTPGGDEMTPEDWDRMRKLVREETRKILFEEVDGREPEPTTVRESLRLSADHARGFPT